MQLPREGVEALSVARLAGEEPEVLHGHRGGGELAGDEPEVLLLLAQRLPAAVLRAAPAHVAVSFACNFCSVDTEKELVLL